VDVGRCWRFEPKYFGKSSQRLLSSSCSAFLGGHKTWPSCTITYALICLARRSQFQHGIPRVTARGVALFRKSFNVDGRVNPGHGPLCHRRPAVSNDILRGQHHDSLSEEVTIPFGKPNFPFIEPNLVLGGAQN